MACRSAKALQLMTLFALTWASGRKESSDSSEDVTAHLGQFPFIVAILYNNYVAKCGGALITSFHVLTAAFCVVVDETDENGAQAKFVMAGDIERIETKNAYQELKNIHLYIPHPNYVIYHDHQYNIGLLKVMSEFKLGSLLHSINFGGYSPPNIWRDHSMTLVGWGNTVQDKPCSVRLHYTHVKFIEKQNCDLHDNDDLFCAVVNYRCPGSIGSPLVIENELHGIFLETRKMQHFEKNVSLFLRVNTQKYWVYQGMSYNKRMHGFDSMSRSLRVRSEAQRNEGKFKFYWIIIWILQIILSKIQNKIVSISS